jgi:hypothetical protein
MSPTILSLFCARLGSRRMPLFAFSAIGGDAIGFHMGSVHLSNLAIYRILGTILLLAGLKLCFT